MLVFSKLSANLQKNMQNSRVGRGNKYILRNCIQNLYELHRKNFGMSKTLFTFAWNWRLDRASHLVRLKKILPLHPIEPTRSASKSNVALWKRATLLYTWEHTCSTTSNDLALPTRTMYFSTLERTCTTTVMSYIKSIYAGCKIHLCRTWNSISYFKMPNSQLVATACSTFGGIMALLWQIWRYYGVFIL